MGVMDVRSTPTPGSVVNALSVASEMPPGG